MQIQTNNLTIVLLLTINTILLLIINLFIVKLNLIWRYKTNVANHTSLTHCTTGFYMADDWISVLNNVICSYKALDSYSLLESRVTGFYFILVLFSSNCHYLHVIHCVKGYFKFELYSFWGLPLPENWVPIYLNWQVWNENQMAKFTAKLRDCKHLM